MKTYRAHVYFEACASFDVEAETHEDAKLLAWNWLDHLPGDIVDTTVEVDGKHVHIEDANGGINEFDVEEEPYEREEA